MKWFRFWTDTLDDVKILQLSDYEYRIWTYLLAIASEVNSMSGECHVNVKSMSLRCRTQVNHFLRALETFQRVGLITIDGDGFPFITNWKKRQFKSDDVTARVRKYREVTTKRNVSCNVSETDQITDTDTDTPIVPKGTAYSVDFLSFWKTYPNRKGKDAAWRSWRKCSGHRPSISQLIEIIEAQKKSEQWKKDNGQFIPHPATWLNQGRWADEPETQKQKARW